LEGRGIRTNQTQKKKKEKKETGSYRLEEISKEKGGTTGNSLLHNHERWKERG